MIDSMIPLATSEPKKLQSNHVIVSFGDAISGDVQGRALLHLERYLRETLGVKAEVYKQTAPDDLKRRREMTKEQRENL